MTNPAHAPTDESRELVKQLSAEGFIQEHIADQVGIDAKTLRKHYKDELRDGKFEANRKVAKTLFAAATEGGSVAAMIFWLKSQAGWREKQEIDLRTPDGIQVEHTVSEEVLERIRAKL